MGRLVAAPLEYRVCGAFDWEGAKAHIQKMGHGWRLPVPCEVQGFDNYGSWWTSEPYEGGNSPYAYSVVFNPYTGSPEVGVDRRTSLLSVVAVRELRQPFWDHLLELDL